MIGSVLVIVIVDVDVLNWIESLNLNEYSYIALNLNILWTFD